MMLHILTSKEQWATSTDLSSAEIEAKIKKSYPAAVIPLDWQPDRDRLTGAANRKVKPVYDGQRHVATIREEC